MRRRKRLVINSNMRGRIKTTSAGLAPLTGKSGLLHNCTKNTTYNSLLKPKAPSIIPKPFLDLPKFDQNLKDVLNLITL